MNYSTVRKDCDNNNNTRAHNGVGERVCVCARSLETCCDYSMYFVEYSNRNPKSLPNEFYGTMQNNSKNVAVSGFWPLQSTLDKVINKLSAISHAIKFNICKQANIIRFLIVGPQQWNKMKRKREERREKERRGEKKSGEHERKVLIEQFLAESNFVPISILWVHMRTSI